MDLRRELENYEIGGIGDIKKHTLRFHSYRIGTVDGKLTIFAEYEPERPPMIFGGYPSGQELLMDLCNLHLELRGKTQEECARILVRWSIENIHPYYLYGDNVEYIEFNNDDPNDYWDCMVNVLECYHVYVEDMLRDLERLYIDTMTVFTLRKLMDGDVAEAQRLYQDVRVPEKENLMDRWYRAEPGRRPLVIKEFVEKLPTFTMNLEYDLSDRQLKLQPLAKSVIDAAYYGLGRFAAVNAGALDDYGGKTNIAFCQACGRAFIKRGNRQKYCGTDLCQSIRNNRKSSDYYYRKKKDEKGNS
jgi:hypothetical protein